MAFQNDEMNGGGNWLLTFPLALFLSHERRGGGRLAPPHLPPGPLPLPREKRKRERRVAGEQERWQLLTRWLCRHDTCPM